MKINVTFPLILFLISPLVVMGMFMYGLLPFPPETRKQVHTSETGEKIILKGVKQQGWGSNGFFWSGNYWPNLDSSPHKISSWIEYSEDFQPQVHWAGDLIIIIQDSHNFQVKNVSGNWQSYSLWESDSDYISSIHSFLVSTKKRFPEKGLISPHIDKFIPTTKELIIRFSVSPYEYSPSLAKSSLLISETGEITINSLNKMSK